MLSVPLSVLASVLLFTLLRYELVTGSAKDTSTSKFTIRQGLATFDFGGTILFFFGVGLIILATAWGGATYPWTSPAVLAPLILGALFFLLFWTYEYLLEPHRPLGRLLPRQSPMIPWSLFARRDIPLLTIINGATGAALYSVFYFVGLYFTLARGYDAATAGTQLLFYIPGLGAGVYAAMAMCNFWPRDTFNPLWLGSAIELVGVGLITWVATSGSIGTLRGMMALAGAGTGLRLMPATLHAAAIWPDRLASVISLMDFAQPFGGTLALTIMGAVFNSKLAETRLNAIVGERGEGAQLDATSGSSESLMKALAALSPEARDAAQAVFADAVHWAFVSVLPFMGLCVLAASRLGNVRVK